MSGAGFTPGQAYRPFNLFYGSLVPFSLAARRDISPGAKLTFAELAAVMGRARPCHPSVEHLAGRLGASIDQVTRWLRELTKAGLIQSRRRGPGSNAERVFIWHLSLAESLKKGADLETAKIPVQQKAQAAKRRVLNPQKSGSEPGNLRVAYKEVEEALLRGSKEELSSSELAEGSAVVTTDDDAPRSQTKPEEFETLISAARERLQSARAEGLSRKPEEVAPPDRAITIRILEAFADWADFEAWLHGTVQRDVAGKANSTTWGLYLTDAKNQAEGLKFARELAEKQARDAEIERQRQIAAEAERQRVMDTPVPFADAAGLAACRVPWVLRAQLERAAEAISPNELIRRSRDWKPCSECRDIGTLGDVLERNLRFCECAAGVEAQYRDGADYCEREIARVHADSRSLLIQAFRSLDRHFAGDALEAATVMDDGKHLEIRLANRFHSLCLVEKDVRDALWRLGWERTFDIIKRKEAAA